MALLPHEYISTACLHEFHTHCQSAKSSDGRVKIPGQCKFCASACRCECHKKVTK